MLENEGHPALWYLVLWVGYSMTHTPVLKLFTFDAEFVTIINAGVIIALVFVVSRVCKDLKPLLVMSAGIFIGTIRSSCWGWVAVGSR